MVPPSVSSSKFSKVICKKEPESKAAKSGRGTDYLIIISVLELLTAFIPGLLQDRPLP